MFFLLSLFYIYTFYITFFTMNIALVAGIFNNKQIIGLYKSEAVKSLLIKIFKK